MIASGSSVIPTIPSPVVSVKKKRSRNGCENCKKLKIKCDELKPRCEYCRSTERECIYRPAKKVSRKSKKGIEDGSQSEFSSQTSGIGDPFSSLHYHNKYLFPHINLERNGCQVTIDLEEFSKWFNENDPKHHKPIYRSLAVQSSSGLNDFERKLVKLLDIFSSLYIPVAGPFNDFLSVEVPALFDTSEVIRLGSYTFCCIHVWNITQIDNTTFADFVNTDTNIFKVGKSHKRIFSHEFTKGSGKNLFENTMNYFLQLVAATNNLAIKYIGNDRIKDETIAKELLFACFVIIVFLGMHGHNLAPLVNMDSEREYSHEFDSVLNLSNDLLTIGSTLKKISAFVVKSLSPLQEVECGKQVLPTSNLLSFPMITMLTSNLDLYYQELYPNEYITDANYIALKSCLNLLQETFSMAFLANRGLPFYKLYVVIEDEFRDLVRAKNPIALEMLFAYSFICLSVRFCVFTDKNVWLNFMNWYKEWNFHVFGDWKYEADKNLFDFKQDDTKDVRFYLDLDPLNIPK